MLQFQGRGWARWLLRLFGWQVVFDGLPGPKGVIIVYPHTSNWDFIIGILCVWAIGVPLKFWAKEGLFTGLSRFTLGPLMRRWGAIALNRFERNGVIDKTVAQMQQAEFFWLALSPEGTRSYKDHWKSGFYQLALQAQVPLGLAALDFGKRVLTLKTFVMLSGSPEQDLQQVQAYYAQVKGCCPERAAPICFRNDSQS
jgi:1-acyl-sn-glycerol-3-phosphate acyltransferase